jgi:hypothetical protein
MGVRPILPPGQCRVATLTCRDPFLAATLLWRYQDPFLAATLTCRDPFPVETPSCRGPFPAAIRLCPDRFPVAIPSFRVPSPAATRSGAKAALKSFNETGNGVVRSPSGSVE